MEEKYAELPPEIQDKKVPWKPVSAMGRCEDSGGHVVHAPSWPPASKPSDQPGERPSLTLQCKRCDAWMIVYADTTGIKIVKPEVAAKR